MPQLTKRVILYKQNTQVHRTYIGIYVYIVALTVGLAKFRYTNLYRSYIFSKKPAFKNVTNTLLI